MRSISSRGCSHYHLLGLRYVTGKRTSNFHRTSTAGNHQSVGWSVPQHFEMHAWMDEPMPFHCRRVDSVQKLMGITPSGRCWHVCEVRWTPKNSGIKLNTVAVAAYLYCGPYIERQYPGLASASVGYYGDQGPRIRYQMASTFHLTYYRIAVFSCLAEVQQLRRLSV